MHSTILNVAFYRFVHLESPSSLRPRFKEVGNDLGIKGTILLSQEGINGFLAGSSESIAEFQRFLQSFPEFQGMEYKESWSDSVPFDHLFIKLKKEIISMGRPDIRPAELTGPRLSAAEFKRWMDEGRDALVLDTRNDYEVALGTFEKAEHLGIQHFRQFSEKLKTLPQEAKKRPVVMFCTGGIRCEKATALALKEGFEQVFQLEGGILKYFEECGSSHYRGDCFVFDERRTVNSELAETDNGKEC
jgi:predicted sulfurtransferase